MRFFELALFVFWLSSTSIASPVVEERQALPPKKTKHLRPVLEKRQQFNQGQPVDAKGNGGPIQGKCYALQLDTDVKKLTDQAGGTNKPLDLQNPDNLGAQSTDNGVVVNLKWSFSDSKTRVLPGGWVREQVITDLPASHDIAAAQQHLKKGALRELHWHRVVSLASVEVATNRGI